MTGREKRQRWTQDRQDRSAEAPVLLWGGPRAASWSALADIWQRAQLLHTNCWAIALQMAPCPGAEPPAHAPPALSVCARCQRGVGGGQERCHRLAGHPPSVLWERGTARASLLINLLLLILK